jgi:hypothetical protein
MADTERFALVGPVENGTDRYLIVDLRSDYADAAVMGDPVGVIDGAGIAAPVIVDILNAHADEFAARLTEALAASPF